MSENVAEKRNRLFQFNWATFNLMAGLKFAVATLVTMLLTRFTEFDFLFILIAAFLAWLTDVPGTTKNRVLGMIAFAIAAIAMLWLAGAVFANALWFTAAMFVVAFIFTLPMAVSQRGYMVGWSTILWFFSIAPLTATGDLSSISWDVLIGVSLVVLITLLWPSSIGPYGSVKGDPPAESGGVDDYGYVVVYALTVGIVTAIGIYIGMNWFTVGTVWVANGAFFVLGPSTKTSWIHGVERAVAVVVGVFLGLLLTQLVSSPFVATIIWATFALLSLAALNASYSVSIASYTAGMTMTWGVQFGLMNARERILTEALAISLGLAATLILHWWANRRQVVNHVQAELTP
jgi:hypothetical protein